MQAQEIEEADQGQAHIVYEDNNPILTLRTVSP